MKVISTRDFRANQSKYLELANRGENLVLKSRGLGSFRIIPIEKENEDTTLTTLMVELRGALKQVQEHIDGKINLQSAKSLIDEI